jgi:hypothetical protein
VNTLIPTELRPMFTDDYGSNSEQCLPFSGIDTVWAVPPEPDEKSEEDYRQAHNRGYRYAAAFFIFTMRNGSERVTIHDVMKSMAEDKRVHTLNSAFGAICSASCGWAVRAFGSPDRR